MSATPARPTRSPFRRTVVLVGAASVIGLAASGTASAHVSAEAPDAAQGGYSVISFRVPNESETAATTSVRIALPADAGLKSVRTEPMPGWTSTVERDADDLATSVTWTAEKGTSIGQDQFGRFDLSVGPLPERASLAFDATQSYSDGSTVTWDEPPNPDGSEPEHPAPEIALAVGGDGEHGDGHGGDHGAAADDDSTAAVDPVASTTALAGTDTTARWLGAGGLLLGALGLGLRVGASVRARRS